MASLAELEMGVYHFLADNKSYTIEIEHVDKSTKEVVLIINGVRYKCDIKSPLDQLIDSLELGAKTGVQDLNLISSMPGLVKEILVTEGQEVHEGDALLILEAMKMENILKAGSSGLIEKIHCEEGGAVEKNQILIEIK